MPSHVSRGWLLAALMLAASAWMVGGIAHAADEELRPDNSLESKALELLSARRGRIIGAQIAESSTSVLTLRISYSGLTSDDLVLTAQAQDRRRAELRGVSAARLPLTAREGEVDVRLELDPARGEGGDQKYLLVQIGPPQGREACVRVFQCVRQWGGPGGEGDGGDGPLIGGSVNVTAQPIGRSTSLPPQRPLTRARLNSELFKVVPANAQTSGAKVRDARPDASLPRPAPVSTTRPVPRPFGMPVRRPIKPRPGVIIGLPGDVAQAEGKGPGASGLSLYDIASDVNVNPDEILSLHPVIFEDENPQSGFFYYLPRGFHLDWTEDEGYALRILYGASAADTNPNTVYISARLTSGISSADLTLAEKLTERYFKSRYPQRKFGGLKPFPITGMKPDLNAEAYNIPKEKLVVTSTMDLGGSLDLSFTTDPVTKENLQAVLTQGLGLNGTVTMSSASDTGAGKLEATVPLTIRLADRDSFDTQPFTRGTAFRNPGPYPAKLKYLHVLMEENPARVYSYSLGDRLAPAGGSANIDARQVREWLDGAALKMWVEYSITGNEATNRKVMEKITGGVANVAQSEITFRTLTPLADSGAALILVTVSSRYLDPKGQMEKVATLELTKDNEAFKLKPIYLVGRQAGDEKPNDPLFKYRLTIVKPDGTMKEGKDWIETSKMTIFIGAAQLKPILEAN